MARDTLPLLSPFASAEFSFEDRALAAYNDGVLDEGTQMTALAPASLAPIKPSSSLGSSSPSLKGRGCTQWPQEALQPSSFRPPVASRTEEGWFMPGVQFPFERFQSGVLKATFP